MVDQVGVQLASGSVCGSYPCFRSRFGSAPNPAVCGSRARAVQGAQIGGAVGDSGGSRVGDISVSGGDV